MSPEFRKGSGDFAYVLANALVWRHCSYMSVATASPFNLHFVRGFVKRARSEGLNEQETAVLLQRAFDREIEKAIPNFRKRAFAQVLALKKLQQHE